MYSKTFLFDRTQTTIDEENKPRPRLATAQVWWNAQKSES